MDSQQMAREMMRDLCTLVRGPVQDLQGFSGGEAGALGYLAARGEPITPTELSRELDLTTARVANILNSLERKDYVQRTHDSQDRRRVLVTVTEKGLRLAEDHRDRVLQQLATVLDWLGEEDAQECFRLLKRILQLSQERTGKTDETGGTAT